MAHMFLSWLSVAATSRWLDVGCGTGALSSAILESRSPQHLAGIDASAGFIAAAKKRLGDGPDLRVDDAQSLPFADDEFDAAVSGLCLNFVPDPAAATREMRRVTRSGGTVAVYLWDYAEGMQMIRRFWDAALDLDPTIEDLDEASRFPLCQPEPLATLFTGSGFRDVQTTALDIPTSFSSFDDYWRPFLGGQGPAPSYVKSLEEDHRLRLATSLEEALGTARCQALPPTAGEGHQVCIHTMMPLRPKVIDELTESVDVSDQRARHHVEGHVLVRDPCLYGERQVLPVRQECNQFGPQSLVIGERFVDGLQRNRVSGPVSGHKGTIDLVAHLA